MKCICELEDGEEVEVYVKYRGFHEDLAFDHLTGELVANQFALDLGLPAARPCLVDVTRDFLSTLPADDHGDAIVEAFNDSDGIAFGSIAFPSVRRWSAENLVHKGQRKQAAWLYLFDTLVENSDRGVGNSNLLVNGHDFKVIDFGHCFQRCHDEGDGEFGAVPWRPDGIMNHFLGDLQHVLYAGLKNCVSVAMIDEFTSALENLSDGVIEDYVTIAPTEWGQDCACKIVDYLLDARSNAADFSANVKGVLR